MERLFVYGTLRQDVPNSKFPRLVGDRATRVGAGRTRGRLFNLGRYPGFLEANAAGTDRWVRGEVYELSEDTLARLDDYEGCGKDDPEPHPYVRREKEIVLDDGSAVRAWVYVYLRPVRPETEILSGDYAEA